MQQVARFVKQKRKQAQLTQVELAARAGVGVRFLRELEAGKATLRCDTVNQVLALFGSSLVAGPSEESGEES
jgi:y4mF family transcriptional regulator